MEEVVMVTPGDVLGIGSEVKAGNGAYHAPHNNTVYSSLTGIRRILPPPLDSTDQVFSLKPSISYWLCSFGFRNFSFPLECPEFLM